MAHELEITAKGIETIVLSYLQHQAQSGALGTLTVSSNGVFLVRLSDGTPFIVKTTETGWSVRNGFFEGLDSDLLEAARLALSVSDPALDLDALGLAVWEHLARR